MPLFLCDNEHGIYLYTTLQQKRAYLSKKWKCERMLFTFHSVTLSFNFFPFKCVLFSLYFGLVFINIRLLLLHCEIWNISNKIIQFGDILFYRVVENIFHIAHLSLSLFFSFPPYLSLSGLFVALSMVEFEQLKFFICILYII